MNRPAMNPPRSTPLQMPGQLPTVSSSPLHPFAAGRPYQIRPTETFTFTEELESARREQQRHQRRTGSGGGVLLVVLMLLAGSAGYVAVKYRVWQDTAPVVERAQELLQSLRTLAPWAPPETLARPAPPRAPTVAATPRLAPEVVPITRDPEPVKAGKTGRTEAKAAAATAPAAAKTADAKPVATTPPAATPARHHPAPAHRRVGNGTAQKASAANADPTEEELLAPSSNRR